MAFSSLRRLISHCFSNSRKTFHIFHAIDVYSLVFLSIYLVLSLSTNHLSHHRTGSTVDCNSIPRTSFHHTYQPIPHSSVCQCLDALPLDYCNSLFHGLPASSIVRLQRVQNSLARTACCSSRFSSHSADLLKTLHWLPVTERIKFKIATLTFKALHYGKPDYLANLVSYYRPSRTLRSMDSHLLTVPDIRTELGRRSFRYAAPTIWNSLPLHIRTCPTLSLFCSWLKTHLFPP